MKSFNPLRPRAGGCLTNVSLAVSVFLGLVPAMILCAGGARADAIPFAPAEFYAAGKLPFNLVTADLDGDGLADIAVNNAGSDSEIAGVSILFNTGNGSFGLPVMVLSGIATRCLAAGDLDGDTDIDLAVGPSFGPLLAVLMNNGDGTFAAPVFSGNDNFRPDACRVRDLDGDQDLDIVMGLAGEAIAGVWMNLGDGTLDGPTIYMSGAPAYTADLTVADLDGDDDLDLATIRTLNIDLPALMRNQGDGTFGPAEPFSSEPNRHVALASGDVDLDGDEDLALLTDGQSRMEVFRNDGVGAFELTDSYSLASHQAIGSRIVLVDLDGDTAPEALVPDRNGLSILVLQNDGGGAFAAPDPHSVAVEPTAGAADDFDGDGNPDLAVTAFTTDRVSVLLNLSPPVVGAPPIVLDPTGPSIVTLQPNPVRGAATIRYTIRERERGREQGRNQAREQGWVRLTLHDVSGRLIGVLADRAESAGQHALSWQGRGENGERLPAGRYILRLEGGGTSTVPVTLLR